MCVCGVLARMHNCRPPTCAPCISLRTHSSCARAFLARHCCAEAHYCTHIAPLSICHAGIAKRPPCARAPDAFVTPPGRASTRQPLCAFHPPRPGALAGAKQEKEENEEPQAEHEAGGRAEKGRRAKKKKGRPESKAGETRTRASARRASTARKSWASVYIIAHHRTHTQASAERARETTRTALRRASCDLSHVLAQSPNVRSLHTRTSQPPPQRS